MSDAQQRFDEFQRNRATRKPTSAREIIDAIKGHYWNPYNGHKWALFEEMRLGTGWGRGVDQRVDLWVMGMWNTNSHARIAYEVKVSRSDFRGELKKPLKRRQALLISNQFYFAAPLGLIKPEEVPIECGLVEFFYTEKDAKLREVTTVHAPWRDTPPPNWVFVAALCRRVERDAQRAAPASDGEVSRER